MSCCGSTPIKASAVMRSRNIGVDSEINSLFSRCVIRKSADFQSGVAQKINSVFICGLEKYLLTRCVFSSVEEKAAEEEAFRTLETRRTQPMGKQLTSDSVVHVQTGQQLHFHES